MRAKSPSLSCANGCGARARSSSRNARIFAVAQRRPGGVAGAPDRAAYARDLWPRGLIGVRAGDVAPFPPDAIVWPISVAEVQAIVRFAAERGIPIVPFGAGSGVCGGTLPLKGGIVVDVKRMR